MNYKKMASSIIEYVGSADNIKESMHCFTRLRLHLIDNSKVNMQAIENMEGIIGVQFQNDQLQIIIGNDVAKVFAELEPMLHLNNSDETTKSSSIIDSLMKTISNIFTPILPAIIGAGLMKGILPILVLTGIITQDSGTYNVMNIVADASFTFLPFLVALSSAKRFKVNEYLAVALAGALFYPSLTNPDVPLNLFNLLDIPKLSYAASVLPIIFGVYAMSIIYKHVDRFIPSVVKMIFTPLITLLISIPLLLVLFGPLGSYIGGYFADISLWLSSNVPALYGLILGGLYPLIIMTGMHYAFFPIMLENIAKLGYENGFLPMGLFANLAMAGSVLAVVLYTKEKRMKEVASSSGVSAVLGITEPALYGVALKLKMPLFSTMIISGLVNAIVVTLGIRMYAFVAPSVLALPAFYGPNKDMNNLILAIVASLASFVLAYLLSSVLLRKGKVVDSNKNISKRVAVDVFAPISGTIVALDQVEDTTFAQGLVGKGVAILPDPSSHQIVAPFDGKITMLTPTNHAIGITSIDGVELLLHVGLETVQLHGEGFTLHVKETQVVNKGDILLSFDPNIISKHNLSCITPVVVLNSKDYLDVIATEEKTVKSGRDRILMIL